MSASDFATLTHPQYGKPVRWWHYTDAFAVAGFVVQGQRKIVHAAVRKGEHCFWHMPLTPAPLPIYRAAALAERPDAPVLLLESEALADSASGLFPDHVCAAWALGSNYVNMADVTPFSGRDVILWPAGDGADSTTIERMRVRLHGIVRSLVVVRAPRTWPVSWFDAPSSPPDSEVAALRRALREASGQDAPPDRGAGPGKRDKPPPVLIAEGNTVAQGDAGPLRPRSGDRVHTSRPSSESAVRCFPPEEEEGTFWVCESDSPRGGGKDPSRERGEGEVGVGGGRDLANETAGVLTTHTTLPRCAWTPPSPPAARAEKGSAPRVSGTDAISDEPPDVPAFPAAVLPPLWRAWVEQTARTAGAPIDDVALALLTAMAGLIGNARRVSPVPGWGEPCVLWTGLVGAPSAARTRARDTVLGLMRDLETRRGMTGDAAFRRHAATREAARALTRRWRQDVYNMVMSRAVPDDLPVDAMEPPLPRRLVVDDVRLDAIAAAMAGRHQGMLMTTDALGAWLKQASRRRAGVDQQSWLKLWSARPWTISRRHQPAADIVGALSILGVLDVDALPPVRRADDDDMLARILVVWPAPPPLRALSAANAEPPAAVREALARLVDLPPEFRDVPLSAAALAVFETFRRAHDQGARGLSGRALAWWRQGDATVLRLAGVLSFLDWATETAEAPEPVQVPAGAIEAAVDLWQTYLWPHAEAVFRSSASRDHQRKTDRVLQWLEEHRPETVSREEIRRTMLSQTVDADGADAIARQLVEAGWLQPLKPEKGGSGRPAVRWQVIKLPPGAQAGGVSGDSDAIAKCGQDPSAGSGQAAHAPRTVSAISATDFAAALLGARASGPFMRGAGDAILERRHDVRATSERPP
ncbi:DUF3987 domain-containing protein [Reyranella sp. CPCC 100927]|uniref:DUF3987 domain-containing protein n=1 Tax=Reyranella sp. CPCC 100927 TaxID=2599616 RepID=UPI0011B7438A|nr:DUF3987 domain-containing protein [Reyranella sp. CPCC 100927]TWS94460.1 DUF3987 domain-containing protein [Reyranella sp. CPCC 100927]